MKARKLSQKELRKLNVVPDESDSDSMFDSLMSVEEFTSLELPDRDLILYPWLPEQSITLITGAPGLGKTWFALSLAVAVAERAKFGPWEVINPVDTLYLDGEMPCQLLQERLKLLGVDRKRFRKRLLAYSDSYVSMDGWPRANLTNEKWREDTKQFLVEERFKLFIIDNLSSLTPGIDENSKQEYEPINSWLLDLRFAGIATVLIHHTNKGGEQRGTSSREDNIDTSILLSRPPYYRPSQGACFKVDFTKARLMGGELHELQDLQFKFFEQDGKVICDYRFMVDDKRAAILRLLHAGKKPKEIEDELGVSASTISQRKREAVDKGWINKQGTFTELGTERFLEE